jgi:hypothetical protein
MSRQHSIGYNILAIIVYFCAPFVAIGMSIYDFIVRHIRRKK